MKRSHSMRTFLQNNLRLACTPLLIIWTRLMQLVRGSKRAFSMSRDRKEGCTKGGKILWRSIMTRYDFKICMIRPATFFAPCCVCGLCARERTVELGQGGIAVSAALDEAVEERSGCASRSGDTGEGYGRILCMSEKMGREILVSSH